MNGRMLSALTEDRADAAAAVAARLGHERRPGEEFAAFWSRVPVTGAVDRTGLHRQPEANQPARIFFSSGGSTGTPKFTLLGHREMLRNSAVHGRGYRSCGIGPRDTVAAWGMAGTMNSEFTMYLALAETGCCTLPLGKSEDPDSVIDLVTRFDANVLLVMPSNLGPVIARLEETGRRLESVRLVVTGGEPLYPSDEARFRKSLRDATVFRSVFQTSDTGTIGYQCGSCGPGEFHLHEELQLAELVEVDDDGTGQLITTNLERHLTPVVRQRTGDLARALRQPCPCGDTAPRIRLAGRAGKIVKFGGEKFALNALMRLKEELGLPLDDFEAVLVRDDAGRDRFVIGSRLLSRDARLQEKARELFSRISPVVAAQLERGVVGPLGFSDRAAGVARTASGKTASFTDRREAASGG
ncbi:AMP-binding protein [Streptomyces cinnamoneus]|uniref:phenylacetate--CoA ligase family protein n=1 Tax=Streptomyces cinnamoneus TaxID=53446 RepID=UPI00340BADD9